MSQCNNDSNFGIVHRLRMVFASIAIILLSAVVIGFSQVRTLEQTTQTLTNASVPVFIRAAQLERELKNLLVLLQTADSIENLAQLETLEQEVATQMAKLRHDTGADHNLHQSGQAPTPMTTSLHDLDKITDLILNGKRTLLRQRQDMDNLALSLHEVHESARTHLETLSFIVAEAIEVGAAHSSRRERPTSLPLSQRYHRNLIRANAITELSLEIETIIDLASGMHKLDQKNELAQTERTLQFKMKTLVVLLARLPDNQVRVALARDVAIIRRLIFAQDGLVNAARENLETYTEFTTYRRDQIEPIYAISELSGDLSRTAQSEVRKAGRDLKANADRLVYILIAAGLFSAVTIVFSVAFLVERQINQRMAKLTKAVLAIAAGHTDTQVNVSGDDELGRMARALEVFKANAEELKRSNTELEKFAYVAAHDLRSPLRAIRDLSDWVVEDPDTEFSEEGREYMTLLQLRVERLNMLLSDLLEYSRVGKEQDDISLVSIAQVVEETVGLLNPEGKYEITYSGIRHEVVTFATPLRHILLNLINNAIKHHDNLGGQIRVSAEVSQGWIVCSVADDGPGIALEYHDRIFNLFQTLRPRDEVEGSGLGLAIIRKLLEHHGGHIKVESDPAQQRGTTFVFHLPDKQDHIAPLKRAA